MKILITVLIRVVFQGMEQNSSNCVFPDSGTSAAKARVLLLTWNVGNCSESTMDERILFHDEDFTTAQSEHNNEGEWRTLGFAVPINMT